MNVNDYILSGILEQYVLGDVSPQEKQEVECLSHIYPEIKEELTKVEFALEGLALEYSASVPTHIKQNIFDLINSEETINTSQTTSNTKVISLVDSTDTKNSTSKSNINKYLIAASVLLIASISSLYLFLNSTFQAKELALNSKIESLNLDKVQIEESYKNQLASLSIENNKIFVLQANNKAPGKTMIVAWNKVTGHVYVNNIQLPSTPTDKQYQLWALKDGKPIDLGVFEVNTNLQHMKNVQGAQAFAVTLEQKGGSPTPNLEQLYAIINI